MIAEHAPQVPEEERFVLFQRVEPTCTDVLGLRLLAGRTLTEQDGAGTTRVAVINETLARDMFGDASPLGRRFGSAGRGLYEVVGVVGAKRHRALGQEPLLEMYAPRLQDTGPRGMWIVARVSEPSPIVLGRLRTVLREIEPDIPFANAAILGLGVGAGAVIAWLGARAIDTRQFGLTSVDPAVVGVVAVFLIAVTAAAAIVPAWRASRVDPINAMRSA